MAFGVPSFDRSGAPEEIRTPDPQIRSLVLYPGELRAPGTTSANAPGFPTARHSYRLGANLARLRFRPYATLILVFRPASLTHGRVRYGVRGAGLGDLVFSGGTLPRWFRRPARS